jgi:hypothetical protein
MRPIPRRSPEGKRIKNCVKCKRDYQQSHPAYWQLNLCTTCGDSWALRMKRLGSPIFS